MMIRVYLCVLFIVLSGMYLWLPRVLSWVDASRSREIGTLRALGFSRRSILAADACMPDGDEA